MIANRTISAYKKCPTLSYEYFRGNKGDISEYETLIQEESEAAKKKFFEEFLRKYKKTGDEIIFDLKSISGEKLAKADGIMKSNQEFTPIIYSHQDKTSSDAKLELEWIKLVFEDNNFTVKHGIICSPNSSRKTRIVISKKLHEIVFKTSLFKNTKPKVILNKHCDICEFREKCYLEIKSKDGISLIKRISRKQILEYEKKGILTVHQLSFTYKPRKRSKKYREKDLFKPEITALALRTRKVFVLKKPIFVNQEIELYFDIEGINEENEYYLFGLLVVNKGKDEYHHFYCRNPDQEPIMWKWFLKLVRKYNSSPIYHYGSYETKVIQKFARKYETDISDLSERMTNVNIQIYGKVYFPVYSNSLKEIGNFLGFSWSIPDSNGIQSIIWRKKWKREGDYKFVKLCIQYNRDDCLSLKLLKDCLEEISNSEESKLVVEYSSEPNAFSSDESKDVQEQFKLVLKSSYQHYENTKISFKGVKNEPPDGSKKRRTKKGYKGQRKKNPRPTKIVKLDVVESCPIHPSIKLTRHKSKTAKRLIIDLKLTRNGIRKEIVKYEGSFGFCKLCLRSYPPKIIRDIPQNTLYGHGVKAYICYNRIALRTPYQKISELFNAQFNEKIHWAYTVNYIVHLAAYYEETEKQIISQILSSKIVHADETPVSIRGETQYVWIFTNSKQTYFKLTRTREGDFPRKFLKDFKGILITDFYSAYDGIKCRHQKCWVHLLRDINQDLRKNPFDIELESFVLELRNLIIPIMESVQRFGLKKRFLKKHKGSVEKFFSKVIDDKFYVSEFVTKYQQRLSKYKVSLFEFINDDGIPWHNNQAERGIRHLAKQRAISGSFFESQMHAYLTLLSIRQTCRFTEKSFFHFLFSKETDLDSFKIKKK